MKIRGNTVGTTMKRPDFNQTDPTKSDYIRNNPIPKVTNADNGKTVIVDGGKYVVKELPNATVTFPSYDLTALGLDPIVVDGDIVGVNTDMTAILSDIEKGSVKIGYSLTEGGTTYNANAILHPVRAHAQSYVAVDTIYNNGGLIYVVILFNVSSISAYSFTAKKLVQNYAPDELPAVSETDNGKILGVVNGKWGVIDAPQAESLPTAEGVAF